MHSGRNQGHQEAISEAHLIMERAIVEEDPLSLQPSDHMSFGVWHRAAGKHDHMYRDPQPQQRAQDGAQPAAAAAAFARVADEHARTLGR